MVPFMAGLLLVMGVAGGIEHLPPDPSASTIGFLFSGFVLGIMLMVAGINLMRK